MMRKGLTAQYLLKQSLPLGRLHAGDFVLFHAAAGEATEFSHSLGRDALFAARGS